MPRSPEALRTRLERAGWTVESLRGNMVRTSGEVSPGANHAVAVLDDFYARVTFVTRYEGINYLERLFGGPMAASIEVGEAKLFVSVLDGGRASKELDRLESSLSSARSFEEAIAAVEAGGWIADRNRCTEDSYDSFGYEIRAQQEGLYLELSVGLPEPHQHGKATITEKGRSSSARGRYLLSANIRSAAQAADLLAALLE
ncbi:MAG: hypothetical protein JRF33_16650 [Deltaproteobacteria bacterium]|nr:hypothetical protein [Deltaproteobacteria bacterium]